MILSQEARRMAIMPDLIPSLIGHCLKIISGLKNKTQM